VLGLSVQGVDLTSVEELTAELKRIRVAIINALRMAQRDCIPLEAKLVEHSLQLLANILGGRP